MKMICRQPGCTATPVFSFTWGWGLEEACCREHRTHTETLAKQLDTQLVFLALKEDDIARQQTIDKLRDEVTDWKSQVSQLKVFGERMQNQLTAEREAHRKTAADLQSTLDQLQNRAKAFADLSEVHARVVGERDALQEALKATTPTTPPAPERLTPVL